MTQDDARELAAIKRVNDHLNSAVLLVDGDLRLKYINSAGEMLFAISAHRFLGQPVDELFHSPELLDEILGALESGRPFTKRELPLSVGYAHRVTVDVTATPISEEEMESELLLEFNQVDRQLRISREEGLLAQNVATRALVRGLAHEVKNPLGGLRGAAQLLERQLPSDELKEYTQIIISEADRLQTLMDRMLGPAALPQKRPVNVHEVLERVRQLVVAEFGGELEIVRDYDPSIPNLLADRDQLIQAVLNIVRNAVQAAGTGGTIIMRSRALRQYTIGARMHKLVAKIEIVDNGPGIPPEMLESIFLPMVTGRPDGTGLGLPLAQSLINMNGGLIECDSRPAHTVFTILLPIIGEHENGT